MINSSWWPGGVVDSSWWPGEVVGGMPFGVEEVSPTES